MGWGGGSIGGGAGGSMGVGAGVGGREGVGLGGWEGGGGAVWGGCVGGRGGCLHMQVNTQSSQKIELCQSHESAVPAHACVQLQNYLCMNFPG